MFLPDPRTSPPIPCPRIPRPLRPDRDDHGGLEHDNTFGTPEEDAFRRDFTINALFYDIATFSIIDYVGGLQDLGAASSDPSAIRASASRRIRFA